jgi:hypothetical protein
MLPSLRGRVEAIAVTEQATAPMRQVEQARALAGRGLDGDRYAAKAGTFSPSWPVRLLAKGPARGYAHGYDLTLIAAEVLTSWCCPAAATLSTSRRVAIS